MTVVLVQMFSYRRRGEVGIEGGNGMKTGRGVWTGEVHYVKLEVS